MHIFKGLVSKTPFSTDFISVLLYRIAAAGQAVHQGRVHHLYGLIKTVTHQNRCIRRLENCCMRKGQPCPGNGMFRDTHISISPLISISQSQKWPQGNQNIEICFIQDVFLSQPLRHSVSCPTGIQTTYSTYSLIWLFLQMWFYFIFNRCNLPISLSMTFFLVRNKRRNV